MKYVSRLRLCIRGYNWQAVVYGYIFVSRKVREFGQWLWWRILTFRIYNAQVQRVPTVRTIRRVLSGFCAEAAVLIAIFPYLDFLIESHRFNEKSQSIGSSATIDMGSVKRQSAILCVLCLTSAIVLAIKTSGEEE